MARTYYFFIISVCFVVGCHRVASDKGVTEEGSDEPDTQKVEQEENTQKRCGDGVDNDGDGHIDCDDQDCDGWCKEPDTASDGDVDTDTDVDIDADADSDADADTDVDTDTDVDMDTDVDSDIVVGSDTEERATESCVLTADPLNNWFFDSQSNSCGAQGSWFTYTDESDDGEGSSIELYIGAAGMICARGISAKANEDWSLWGAGFGVNLCEELPISQCNHSTKLAEAIGFRITLMGTIGECRVTMAEYGRDENTFITARQSDADAAIPVDYLFENATVEYSTSSPPVDASQVNALQFQFSSNQTSEVPFDVCVADVQVLFPEDLGIVPDVDTEPVNTDTEDDSEDTSMGDTIPFTCESTPYQLEQQPSNVLILLDRSASMVQFDFDGTSFEIVVDNALKEIALDPMYRHLSLGLAAYPSQQCNRGIATSAEELCYAADEISVPIAPGTGESIVGALDLLDTCGGAPTSASLRFAKDYLANDLTAEALGNPTSVLLITDGAPNCSSDLDISTCMNGNPDQALSQPEQCVDSSASQKAAADLYEGSQGMGFTAVAKDTGQAFELQVPTYVVGLGDLSDWNAVMNGIANNGGGETQSNGMSSQYYPVLDEASVTTSLKSIVADASTCTFPISWDEIPVKDTQKGCGLVKVYPVVNGNVDPNDEMRYSSGCEDPYSWHYQGDSGNPYELSLDACSTIELCPSFCDELKSGQLEGVSMSFGCKPLI